MRIPKTIALAAVLLAGCSNGDFLFRGAIDGVPGVIHITAEDGGDLVPFDPIGGFEAECNATLDERDDCLADDSLPGCDELAECEATLRRANVDANAIYAEVGPTGNANPSGATFNFQGTGGSVCVFVDPELLHWNESVSSQAPERHWRYPDNPYDDGDMDMQAGLSVYYTGTEGEDIGSFNVQYQDSLGNTIPVNLVSCAITANVLGNFNPTATGGRGAPEYCTVANTQPGVSYTVALTAFSLPPDDDRLSFGMLLADGGCTRLIEGAAPSEPLSVGPVHEECLIVGEAIPPLEGGTEVYYGYEADRSWTGSEEFESHYCSGERMPPFCNSEADAMREAGQQCDFASAETVDEKCYCGDTRDTPSGGAL